jgi:hypothetical protein
MLHTPLVAGTARRLPLVAGEAVET